MTGNIVFTKIECDLEIEVFYLGGRFSFDVDDDDNSVTFEMSLDELENMINEVKSNDR